jgi:competence ComEA-like helix-hairpin-helix protein
MLDLTQEERKVVLFLMSVALLGAGISFLSKKYQPVRSFICSGQDITKIDLNKADKETLISISGIGEKISQRILDYRAQTKGFNSVEELKNIKGITNYRYEKFKDNFYVK